MNSLNRAIVVALITFGASAVGMALQSVVPADILTQSKVTVGAMVGLVTLLLALVLGLLVFTAFSVFTTQQSEAQSLGPVIAEIEVALDQYGPEAVGGRAGLRAALERSRVRFFGDSKQGPQPFTFEEMKATLRGLNSYFDSLKPVTDSQRRWLASAWDLAKKYQDTQMLMARQLAAPFPPYVLVVVVCWASALFLGNGLVATPNAVTALAHLAGAIAVASATFLILELSSPYTGVIRLSPAGIDRVLAALGEVEASPLEPRRPEEAATTPVLPASSSPG
ncbi:MAG TPA: hypothetical protein VMS87_05995 [Roseiarcus sp.]|nr:hypothetical protein [Roseiarcus sp.]